MKAYIDSSVILRIVLGQPGRLEEWAEIEEGVASALVEVECLRTLDRLRVRDAMRDEDIAVRRETVFHLLGEMHLIEVARPILVRASHPFPTPIGTLDAIHLATALLAREEGREDLVLATHDTALALAARACGIPVTGA